jgi:hypothetical protein
MNTYEICYYMLMELLLCAVRDVAQLPTAQDWRVVERQRVPAVVYIEYTYLYNLKKSLY